MPSYDQFAPYFDAWQRAFGSPYDDLILPRIVAALNEHAAWARRVADLGVGTGGLATALAARGYEVTGVDRSAPMLAVARTKAEAAGLTAPPLLLLQDLRNLSLDAPVDAAVCVYTVVNQLTGDGDLDRALAAVHRALVPGGLFLFELNLPASYDRYWSGTETVHADGAVVTRTHRRAPGSAIIEALVTIRHGTDEFHDRIAQRPYGDAEVAAALVRTGFTRLACDAFNPFESVAAPMKALWIVRRQRTRT